MTRPDAERKLDKPAEIRDDTGKRKDGRSTGHVHEGIRPGVAHEDAPTVPPEDEGAIPTTEHGPGGDLR